MLVWLLRLFVLIMVTSALTPYVSMGQEQCDQNIPGCGAWSNPIPGNIQMPPTCRGYFTYQMRTCPDGFQYRFSDITVVGVCDGITFSQYENNRNGGIELIIFSWLATYSTSTPCSPEPPTPNASNYTYVFTASCGVWVTCEYEVIPGSENCEVDFLPPSPMEERDGKKYVKIHRYQQCGVACCLRKYEVCYDVSGFTKVRLLDKRVIGNGCTEQGNYEKQCVAGC